MKGGKQVVFKYYGKVQNKAHSILRYEHSGDVGGNRLIDERCGNDQDIRHHSLVDMGTRKCARLHSLRLDRTENTESPRGLLLEAYDVDMRHYVRIPELVIYERNVDGIHRHSPRRDNRNGYSLRRSGIVYRYSVQIRYDTQCPYR